MALIDKVEEVRDDMRMKHMKAKLEEAGIESLRLREQNRNLQDQLQDRPARKPHRVRRLAWMSLGVGCAYVLGARAGHERYAQMREWAQRAMHRGSSEDPTWESSGGSISEATMGSRADDANVIRAAARDAKDKTADAARTAADRVGGAAKNTKHKASEVVQAATDEVGRAASDARASTDPLD